VFFAVYDKIYDFIIKSILNAFQRDQRAVNAAEA